MEQTPSLTTRLLHGGLALGISTQLVLSTFMEIPKPGDPRSALESIGFELHEVFGILSLLLIVAWFVWLFMRRSEAQPGELFPWFSSTSRQGMFESMQNSWVAMRAHHWPAEVDNIRLARAVHGLGALCALGMALSGFMVWFGMSEQGELTAWAHDILDFHQALASLMWIYVLTHAAMALLHHGRGEATLQQMFNFRRSQRIPAARAHNERPIHNRRV
jgi:cytochrome b561